MADLAFAAIAAWMVAFALTGWLAHRIRHLAVDVPGQRSLHERPTPRTGGIGLLAGLLAGIGVLYVTRGDVPPPFDGLPPAVALGLLVTVSFLDDLGHVSILSRLLVQIAVAAVLATATGLPVPWLILAVAGMVWMVNLYNFMDGMDGFAGGMAVFGFGTLATLAVWAGADELALVPSLVTVAALGFLAWNFPPARIFLGDAGATFLGMLAAWLLLVFHRQAILPIWLGLLLFAPFVVDATVTLLRRMLRGDRFWEPHREHYYQRLVRRGWGHRRTVLFEYFIMAGCSVTVLLVWRASAAVQWLAVAGWLILFAVLMRGVDATERNEGA